MKKSKSLRVRLDVILKDGESESKIMRESLSLNNLLSTENSINSTPKYNQIGLNYYNKGEYDKAIESFQKALHSEGESASVHYNLGLAYQAKGILDEAAREYKRSLELNPSDAEAHNNLGIIYYTLGKNDKAITEFREAVRINPDFELARKNLEKIS
ncbi:MAG TPA: tetratricopeptide repeat protein [candidate division WOR-3 bacterium]|uniref:Tetratricopeptide repeat protein n=1 Tax=candidate division WOR-3 bacterium TaxID=2052148 RepID=A0A7V5HMV4_UNCW3|nr:tetratricopeptide repeat protein [candidate division WOR-3 bacterium]